MTPLRTPKSAADWLGVSVKTLRGLVQDSELRYVNVGRGKKNIRRMFADEDLQDTSNNAAPRWMRHVSL
jgi:excisionase family DNA binding protein